MSQGSSFDIEEYAKRMGDRADFAGGLMKHWYGILRDYERSVNPEKSADTPVSKEFVYDRIDAERVEDVRSALPKGFFGISVEHIFAAHRAQGEVSRTVLEHMERYETGNRAVERYDEKIQDIVEDIQEYDEDFELDV